MFVIGNFLGALASVIDVILSAYMWVIIGRAIISWINADPYNPIVRFLYEITEPVLARIRRVLPPMGALDFSPMILILAMIFLRSFLVPTLQQLARTLG
ncbi:MAG: YggT family protein [Desulfobulbaceae bacterium]|nr:YggT family protein [Desulfobulbaceae bacterium]HIJ79667.1 YggT family protein [Deltaproteobacteria bacterium]